MKKFLISLLTLSLLWNPVYAADQWDKTDPAGTESNSDIDTLIQANNEALDRLVINYKRGLGVNYLTASTLTILAGEIAIPNAAGSIVRWRRQAANTTADWSLIDTGSEANSTQYYLYATADTDVTGIVYKIATSSSAPSGATYYRKIAEFYNDASGNITNVKSLRQDDGADYSDLVKARVTFDASGTITNSYNVSSITDNGTGDFTINFSTAFGNDDYQMVGSTKYNASDHGLIVTIHNSTAPTTTSCRILTIQGNSQIAEDSAINQVVFFGERT